MLWNPIQGRKHGAWHQGRILDLGFRVRGCATNVLSVLYRHRRATSFGTINFEHCSRTAVEHHWHCRRFCDGQSLHVQRRSLLLFTSSQAHTPPCSPNTPSTPPLAPSKSGLTGFSVTLEPTRKQVEGRCNSKLTDDSQSTEPAKLLNVLAPAPAIGRTSSELP